MQRTILLIFVGAALLALVARAGIHFFSPNLNTSAEANGLYGALELADGHALYPTKDQLPLGIYLYPPMHAYLTAAIIRGLGLTTISERVEATRFLSLFSFFGALFLFYFGIVRPRKISWQAFCLAVILGLSRGFDYLTTARNDSVSLFFEVAAMVAFLSWIRKPGRARLLFFILISVISVWTRQTGIAIFAAAMMWLLFSRRWILLFSSSALYLAANGVLAALFYQATNGAIFEHVILANIRGFRPFNSQFIDASLITFVLCVFLFGILFFAGFKRVRSEGATAPTRFIFLSLVFSFLLSFAVFFRAGGDVNYFFLPLLIGTLFVASYLESKRRARIHPYGLPLAIVGQLLVITLIYGLKSQVALRSSALPFAEAAQRIKKEFPGLGFISGNYAQSMGVYLRGWAIHGPDVSNASLIARNADPRLRPILTDLQNSIRGRKVSTLVVASHDCLFPEVPIAVDWDALYEGPHRLYPWLCVYRLKPLVGNVS